MCLSLGLTTGCGSKSPDTADNRNTTSLTAPSSDSRRVVARYANQEITYGEFQAYLTSRRLTGLGPTAKKRMLEQYVERLAVAEQIIAGETLDKYALVSAKRQAFANAVIASYLSVEKDKIAEGDANSNVALKRFYESNLDKFQTRHYRLDQIFIKTTQNNALTENKQALAINVYEALRGGSTFAELKKQYSQPNFTNGAASTSEWQSEKELPPTAMKALTNLEISEVTRPLQTAQGLIIYQLLESKLETQPFTEVSSEIRYRLANRSEVDLLRAIKLESHYEILGGKL